MPTFCYHSALSIYGAGSRRMAARGNDRGASRRVNTVSIYSRAFRARMGPTGTPHGHRSPPNRRLLRRHGGRNTGRIVVQFTHRYRVGALAVRDRFVDARIGGLAFQFRKRLGAGLPDFRAGDFDIAGCVFQDGRAMQSARGAFSVLAERAKE